MESFIEDVNISVECSMDLQPVSNRIRRNAVDMLINLFMCAKVISLFESCKKNEEFLSCFRIVMLVEIHRQFPFFVE